MIVSERFAEESIFADAQQIDGMDDFGDDEYREPLRILLASLAEAPIHELVFRLSLTGDPFSGRRVCKIGRDR
jgi:hypothetical protein